MAHTQSNLATPHTQAEYDEVFALMEAAIRLNEYGLEDLLIMTADVCVENPLLARSVLRHAAAFMLETEGDQRGTTTVTDVIVESYRRALFDIEYSAMYGTDWFIGNIEHMKTFVNGYIAGQTMGDDEPMTADPAPRTAQ